MISSIFYEDAVFDTIEAKTSLIQTRTGQGEQADLDRIAHPVTAPREAPHKAAAAWIPTLQRRTSMYEFNAAASYCRMICAASSFSVPRFLPPDGYRINRRYGSASSALSGALK